MTKLLGPRSRQAVMGAFFTRPGYEAHVREVARTVGISPASASQALSDLEGEGVLVSRTVGRNRLYRLAATGVARSAQDLYSKTAGVEGLIGRELRDLPGAEGIYLIGSYAAGVERPGSDIDVLIIGEPDRRELDRRVLSIEAILGREINPSTISLAEFEHPTSGFARTVKSRRMIAIKPVNPPG